MTTDLKPIEFWTQDEKEAWYRKQGSTSVEVGNKFTDAAALVAEGHAIATEAEAAVIRRKVKARDPRKTKREQPW